MIRRDNYEVGAKLILIKKKKSVHVYRWGKCEGINTFFFSLATSVACEISQGWGLNQRHGSDKGRVLNH